MLNKEKLFNIITNPAFIMCVMIVAGFMYVKSNYGILINKSESLPEFVFIIKKDELPKQVGQYIVFKPQRNIYWQDETFVKQITGMQGDILSKQPNTENSKATDIYINDKYLCTAKEKSRAGDALEAISFSGEIMSGYYFVTTPHKDSYDSRYEDIGLIKQEEILGVAIPVL
jgi:conjugal transfer pilin signal peptidase TrbI